MNLETVIYEKRDSIAIITLNRPEVLNAINLALRTELSLCWEDVASDDAIRVAIITGRGRGFCAGADIKQRETPLATSGPSDVGIWNPRTRGWPSGFDIKKPVIAAINGVCVGGGHALALDCDLRIASTEARFGDIEIRHGILGPVDKLVWAYPMAVAMYLGLSGDIISAQQAYHWGMVSHLVEPDELMPKAIEVAETIASRRPQIAEAYKALAREVAIMSPADAYRLVTETSDRVRINFN